MNDAAENDRPSDFFSNTTKAVVARGTNRRFFARVDWLSFGITTPAALSVYLFTLAPSVTLEWSGILCADAMYAGVGPPPGYPVWTIYAWLFTVLLPVSNIAWRVGVSSAVAGALACGMISLMTSRGAGLIASAVPSTLTKTQIAALRIVSGCFAGAIFGLDGGFWNKTVVVDPWPLSILLFCVAFCFLMKWFYGTGRKRWLYAGCLFYGLTTSTSQALLVAGLGIQILILLGKPALGRDLFFANVLFALELVSSDGFGGHFPVWPDVKNLTPIHIALVTLSLAFCIGAIIKTRAFLTEWKAVLMSAFMFLLGLATYLYVPLASMTTPPVNWAYSREVTGFFHMLTRGQFERIYPIQSIGWLVEALFTYGRVAVTDFGLPYLVLALVPFLFLRRMPAQEKRWMFALIANFLCLSIFMLVLLNPGADRSSVELYKVFFSASHIVLAIWAGLGVMLLGIRCSPVRELAINEIAC